MFWNTSFYVDSWVIINHTFNAKFTIFCQILVYVVDFFYLSCYFLLYFDSSTSSLSSFLILFSCVLFFLFCIYSAVSPLVLFYTSLMHFLVVPCVSIFPALFLPSDFVFPFGLSNSQPLTYKHISFILVLFFTVQLVITVN